jgi:hypothetical protein
MHAIDPKAQPAPETPNSAEQQQERPRTWDDIPDFDAEPDIDRVR